MQTKSEMINRIAELAKENAELKAYMDVNEDFKKAWEELKAENEQLKALCDTYKTCYQAKHNDIDGKLFKYRQTLQEIENVLLWIDSSNVWYNGQKAYMGDELIEFLKSRIINIINSTKAEEE